MFLMRRVAAFGAFLVWSAGAEGSIHAEHPSDYVRVLETDQPLLWDEAVNGLLGEEDELPTLSVSSVVRRFDVLDPRVQLRVVRALGEHPRHPRTGETLALVRGQESRKEPTAPAEEVRDAAREMLLTLHQRGRLPAEWAQRLSDPGESKDEAEEEPYQQPATVEEVSEPRLATPILVGSAVLSGIVGVLVFIWSFRLFQLAVRVRNRPVSKVSALAMGPVALEGEVQPAGGYLRHPVTGEACVYYAGADDDHPETSFFLEDGTGRVLIDPRRAVLFSDDDVLVAGERVHLVGFAGRDGDGRVIIRKDETPPPLYRRMVHGAIKLLLGFGHGTSVTRMLFSDPHRCYWIWDDLERRPMGEARDVFWPAAGFLLGGAWMVVFALAVAGLIDEGAMNTFLQIGVNGS